MEIIAIIGAVLIFFLIFKIFTSILGFIFKIILSLIIAGAFLTFYKLLSRIQSFLKNYNIKTEPLQSDSVHL